MFYLELATDIIWDWRSEEQALCIVVDWMGRDGTGLDYENRYHGVGMCIICVILFALLCFCLFSALSLLNTHYMCCRHCLVLLKSCIL